MRNAKQFLGLLVRMSHGNALSQFSEEAAHYRVDRGKELETDVDMRHLAEVRNKRGE